MQFGFCVPCFANPGAAFFRTPAWTALDASAAVEACVLAEDLGYDSLWMADHLIHGVDGGILEGWTTLAVLAGRTRRIALGTIHLAHPFRHPALVAKMAGTLDALAPGRLIFFYDAGWGRGEIEAYGIPFLETAERVARMDEGLDLIKQLWTGEVVNFQGQYYQTRGAVCLPAPRRRPPVWLGEVRDDAYNAAIAKHADGWNTVPVSVTQLQEKWSKVEAACQTVGRDASRIGRSLEIQILVRRTRAKVRAVLKAMAALAPSPRVPVNEAARQYLASTGEADPPLPEAAASAWLIGTPDEVAAQVAAYEAVGVDHLMLWFVDFPSTDGLRLFREAVMPRWGGR